MSDPKHSTLIGLVAAADLGANIFFPNRTLADQFAHFQQETHQRQVEQAGQLQQAFNIDRQTPGQVRPGK